VQAQQPQVGPQTGVRIRPIDLHDLMLPNQ
jgi:hypothetical protein